jgi:hypothetical protein
MTEDKTLTDNDQIIPLIRQHFPALQERFNVADLAVFGSVARGQAREDSDVDVLVRFKGTATSADYFGLQFYLEDLLGRDVDLVTDKALRAELRPFVERDARHV